MRQRIVEWMIGSVWFKKYAGQIGAFALGLWFQARFWKQIHATLDAWGVAPGEYTKALVVVIGAAGVATSIGLSLVKAGRDKADAANNPGKGDGG